MRLDGDAQAKFGGGLAGAGKTVDHDLVFACPIPLRLDLCRPFLRGRPLQDRPDLRIERIGRHRGDDRRAERCDHVEAVAKCIDVGDRGRGAGGVTERHVAEDVGEGQPLAVGYALQLPDLVRRVVCQRLGRPDRQLEPLAARASKPLERLLVGRVPVEGPDRGPEEQRAGGQSLLLCRDQASQRAAQFRPRRTMVRISGTSNSFA